MEVLNQLVAACSGKKVMRRKRSLVKRFLCLFWALALMPCSTLALQRHELPGGESPQPVAVEKSAAPSRGPEGSTAHPAVPATGAPQAPHGATPGQAAPSKQAVGGAAGGSHGAAPTHEAAKPGAPAHGPVAGEHGAAAEGHGEGHGPALPEISPTPGVTFVETMINLMEQELKGRTFGWRPNDILIGRFTDNVNNFQLGVLEAIRFTTLRLKDSLTRMGDADTYDRDLETALNLLMNSSTKFWFPSAEDSYGEAVDHLKAFVEKLKTGKRNFYYRKDNLVLLLSTYKDLLGNVNKTLIAPMDWFKSDDAFYYAKGVAHVYYEILRVIRAAFEKQLGTTLYAKEMLDEIIHELHRTEVMDPWIVLDSDLGGILANHRANLNAPLSETAHLLVILSQL